MHKSPSQPGAVLLATLLLTTLLTPTAASTPQLDVVADLGGLLAKSLQLLRLNLNSVFGTSEAPVHSRVLQEANSTDCLLPVWTCPNCINVPDSVYQTVLNTTCEAVTGLDLFVCGSSILDATVVDAVRSNQCIQSCAGSQPSLQCPVSPTATSSPPLSPPASSPALATPLPTPVSPATPSAPTPSPPSPITTTPSTSPHSAVSSPEAGELCAIVEWLCLSAKHTLLPSALNCNA